LLKHKFHWRPVVPVPVSGDQCPVPKRAVSWNF